MQMFDLSGARVVITGAAGGVGTALCQAFSKQGAVVVGCDRTPVGIPKSCAQSLHFDLQDFEAVDQAAHEILLNGPPNILISNAGWTRAELLSDVGPESVTSEMDGNFTGAVRLCMALLPAMRAGAGDRSIVFVASVNAQAHFGNPVYSAAKSALLAWMRSIATEEGRNGIRANAVVPASIQTNAWDHRLEQDPNILTRVARLYPLGRLVTPQEVANAILFLASPMASGITGTTLNVDAGLMAGNLPFIDVISSLERP